MAALKYFSNNSNIFVMLVLGVLCYCWMMTGFWFPRRSMEIYGRDQFRARSNSLLLHTCLLLTPQSSEAASLLLGRHLIITSCGVPLTYSVVGRVLVTSLQKVSDCVSHLDFTEEGRSGPQFFFPSPKYLAGVKCFFLNSFCLARSPFLGLLNREIRLS